MSGMIVSMGISFGGVSCIMVGEKSLLREKDVNEGRMSDM